MKIRNIRTLADDLLKKNSCEDAYYLYDEIYSQIWIAIGTIEVGLSNFSQKFLGNSYQSHFKLKNYFTYQAAESTFKKRFELDVDQTLNELSFTIYGHLQCICYSTFLSKIIPVDLVYLEFLVLLTLINGQEKDDWVSPILRIASPVIEDLNLKKLRQNVTDLTLKKLLVENAEKIKKTDWKDVNIFLVDYLFNMGDNYSDLYIALRKIVGNQYRYRNMNKKKTDKKEEKYQQSNYKSQSFGWHESYERYEKFEKGAFFKQESFDPTRATDYEKSKHYASVLGLEGNITKVSIRKKYLELIAQYHPDKVFDLGEDLKILAEIKTKQLNAAYDWMKKKYLI